MSWYDQLEYEEVEQLRREVSEMKAQHEAARQQALEDQMFAELDAGITRKVKELGLSETEADWIVTHALTNDVDLGAATKQYRDMMGEMQQESSSWPPPLEQSGKELREAMKTELQRSADHAKLSDPDAGSGREYDLDRRSDRVAYMHDKVAASEYEG